MSATRKATVRAWMTGAALLAALWWLLAGGHAAAWLIGVPAVLAATAAGIRLGGPVSPRLALSGLPRFAVLFLRESLRGGIDVARRTLAPRLRIRPGFRTYRTTLDDPLARLLLVNCISLLPGTLAADLHDEQIVLHLLDNDIDPGTELLRLEQAIAGLVRPRAESTHD